MVPFCPAVRASLARIVTVLAAEFDQSDGAGHAAMAGVLTTAAAETGAAERYAREFIRRAQ